MKDTSWKADAKTDEWNASSNWSDGVPKESSKALFSKSSQTMIRFSGSSTSVDTIVFDENSPPYTILYPSDNTEEKYTKLTIRGAGVTNLSSYTQSFIVAATATKYQYPQLTFTNSAQAGDENVHYCSGPVDKNGWGGGVISFQDAAKAGSARFKVWTGATSPKKHKPSTVGGEVSFSNNSSAHKATFTIYGTLGTDGDTFGNVVFHDRAKAGNAKFINVGGTVSGGDGGNTQFYNSSCADYAVFENYGGTYDKVVKESVANESTPKNSSNKSDDYTAGSNGGDVAFDGKATGGHGVFHNYAAKGKGSFGGVTSFNNNWPHITGVASSAGKGKYFTYGASDSDLGGGGHVSFSAKYGSPTAESGKFVNYGSAQSSNSSAGHTIFSVTYPNPSASKDGSLPEQYEYFPTADNAIIYNYPATVENGAAAYTEFTVFVHKGYEFPKGQKGPQAANSVITNIGGKVRGAKGGYTVFGSYSTADNSTLIAYGGENGGYGGKITFYNNAMGCNASIKLYGNGELNINCRTEDLTIGSLYLSGGIVCTQIGEDAPCLIVNNDLNVESDEIYFDIYIDEKGFHYDEEYSLLRYSGLSSLRKGLFTGSELNGIKPTFVVDGDVLKVKYCKSKTTS